MKTKEELEALKKEVQKLNAKLALLKEHELAMVCGKYYNEVKVCPGCGAEYVGVHDD